MHQSMSVISQTTYNSINSEIKFSLNPNENAAHVSTPKKNILKATLKKLAAVKLASISCSKKIIYRWRFF
jgi:hypothetical protein